MHDPHFPIPMGTPAPSRWPFLRGNGSEAINAVCMSQSDRIGHRWIGIEGFDQDPATSGRQRRRHEAMCVVRAQQSGFDLDTARKQIFSHLYDSRLPLFGGHEIGQDIPLPALSPYAAWVGDDAGRRRKRYGDAGAASADRHNDCIALRSIQRFSAGRIISVDMNGLCASSPLRPHRPRSCQEYGERRRAVGHRSALLVETSQLPPLVMTTAA